MAINKYIYVKDKNGELINIEEITQDNKHNDYYCIECGNAMIAAYGKERKYFRHKGEVTCNRESYLHKLGKMFFKKQFEVNQTFKISYLAEKKCVKSDCFYNNIQRNKHCQTQKVIQTINLKDDYDICEDESGYNGFIADLKLSNSQRPEIEPIFIEIYVTHSCEQEKINSGIKIIEIKIENEEDVLKPLNDYYNHKVTFYNFNRIIPIEQLFSYYALIKENNELRYRIGELSCLTNEDKEDYLIKCILPHTSKIEKIRELELYGLSILAETKNLKFCRFCYWYHHKRCAIQTPIEQINIRTNQKRIIIQRIPIREYKGNYLLLATQCDKYTYDNHIRVYPPINLLKTIRK